MKSSNNLDKEALSVTEGDEKNIFNLNVSTIKNRGMNIRLGK